MIRNKFFHLSGITRSSCLKSLRVIINFFFRSFDLSLENSRRLLLIKLGEFKTSLDLFQDSLLLAKLLSNFWWLSFERLSVRHLAIERLGDLLGESSICYCSDDLQNGWACIFYWVFTLMTGLSLSNWWEGLSVNTLVFRSFPPWPNSTGVRTAANSGISAACLACCRVSEMILSRCCLARKTFCSSSSRFALAISWPLKILSLHDFGVFLYLLCSLVDLSKIKSFKLAELHSSLDVVQVFGQR